MEEGLSQIGYLLTRLTIPVITRIPAKAASTISIEVTLHASFHRISFCHQQSTTAINICKTHLYHQNHEK